MTKRITVPMSRYEQSLEAQQAQVETAARLTRGKARVKAVLGLLTVAVIGLGVAANWRTLANTFGMGSEIAATPTLMAVASELTAPHPGGTRIGVIAASPAPKSQFRLRSMQVPAPVDPFEPVAAATPAATAEMQAAPNTFEPGPWLLGDPAKPASTAAAKPAPAAPSVPKTEAPAAEQLLLVGIIQGDPALVVVKYDGQSFFLKIGDQVANTWRLEKISERSAVFTLGNRRAEVPLREGSSL